MAKKIKTTKKKFTAPVVNNRPIDRPVTETYRAKRRATDPKVK